MEVVSIPRLSKDFIAGNSALLGTTPLHYGTSYPEKVLQFGTGVLLRGLPDYLINKANNEGIFKGSIVIVKSTDAGDPDIFSRQDNLYTIGIRGVEDGADVEENVVCTAISRVLSAKTDWATILDCATSNDMRVVISNTTEVGIELVQDDITSSPPVSFPGKLLAFLFKRYVHFNGDSSKGMVIVPTELISDNGKKLESIILELAHRNGLDGAFIDWIEQHNYFCNSLVDRIVPGVPELSIREEIESKLGYKDDLLTITEVYKLWAIEGNEYIKSILSFYLADEGVIIEPSIDLYRELKLRLLNGTHTLSCGLSFLCGINTVHEAMQDKHLSTFMRNLMLGDIAAAIPYDVDEKTAVRFAGNTLERFKNPHIKHFWINITMHYTNKMAMRTIPVLLKYSDRFHSAPQYYSLGFAAYLLFMKGNLSKDGKYYGIHEGKSYLINDPKAEYFSALWKTMTPEELTKAVMHDKTLWAQDLTLLPGFYDLVCKNLSSLINNGARKTLQNFNSNV